MPESTKTKVARLLRVLVAGGVALAGLAGSAEDKPANDKGGPEKAQVTDKEKAAATAKSKTEDKSKKEAKDAETKGAEAGGVKGW